MVLSSTLDNSKDSVYRFLPVLTESRGATVVQDQHYLSRAPVHAQKRMADLEDNS